jgi:hypothetical protein
MAVELRSNLGDSNPKETGKLILYGRFAFPEGIAHSESQLLKNQWGRCDRTSSQLLNPVF